MIGLLDTPLLHLPHKLEQAGQEGGEERDEVWTEGGGQLCQAEQSAGVELGVWGSFSRHRDH